MTNTFEEVMAKRTDEELIRILTVTSHEYLTSAIEAARKEFEKRNLHAGMVNNLKEKLVREQEKIEIKSKENLPGPGKFLLFLFPSIIIQMLICFYYKNNGYDKKASDVIKWTIYGFGFYISLFMLISLF